MSASPFTRHLHLHIVFKTRGVRTRLVTFLLFRVQEDTASEMSGDAGEGSGVLDHQSVARALPCPPLRRSGTDRPEPELILYPTCCKSP